MNRSTKNIIAAIGVAGAGYLAFTAVAEWRKHSLQSAAAAAKGAKEALQDQREDSASAALADTFAKCAADSLTPRYLKEFITNELMPLGIAWQLYERGSKSKSDGLKKDGAISPEDYAVERLQEHFRRTLYSELQVHHSEVQVKLREWGRAVNEGLSTNLDPAIFNRYPSSLVFKSFSSSQFKNVNPEDIQLGITEVDWPKFVVLAKRCKATPSDLREMSRDPTAPSEQLPSQDSVVSIPESMEYGGFNSNPKYSNMKQRFWKKLSETTVYKDAHAEIKAENSRVIREIIKANEPLKRQKSIEKKAADDVIFRSP